MDSIELLEPRISPAALVGNVLTYTDLDGDLVKVTFTKATMVAANFTFYTGSVDGTTNTPQGLEIVNLTGKTGAGFTLVAKPQGGKGNSHADIYFINGTNTDLGKISVDGDVESLQAGTGAAGTVGLQSFTALSMGHQLTSSQLDNLKNVGSFTIKHDAINEQFNFTGGVKSISIGGNLAETIETDIAQIKVTGGDVGTIKIGGSIIAESGGEQSLLVSGSATSISIGGSVIGGATDMNTAQIDFTNVNGTVKLLTIGGDLRGSGAKNSGAVLSDGSIGIVKIGGSVIGGGGVSSGSVVTGKNPTSVSIGGSVTAMGTGSQSGFLDFLGSGTIASFSIGGSLIGSTAIDSGSLSTSGNVTKLAIGHDVVGAASLNGENFYESGNVYVQGNVGTFSLGGSLVAGRVDGAGSTQQDGSFTAGGTVGSIAIGGSVIGDPTDLAFITVAGTGTTGAVNAIKSLSVKGSVLGASIESGYYGISFSAGNTDSGIGSIKIGGDLAGSFISAGDGPGADSLPGNADDPALSTIATIGSVKIGGAFEGIENSATNFHIRSANTEKVTIGSAVYTKVLITTDGGSVSVGSVGNAIII